MSEATGLPIVIDASIALRWLLPDPLSEACWNFFERSTNAGYYFTAPTLLTYEVVSGLTKAVYFKNISPEEARKNLLQFSSLEPLLVGANDVLSQRAFEWTLRMNRVAAYDSFYLALAESITCELWTADKRLYHAARDAHLGWVRWVEES